jgi:mannose-6-phosphate isomerase-like protein (cupin superfamily)
MPDYTKLNIKELDDRAVQFGLGGSLEARFLRGPLELERFGFSYQRFAPGFRLPFGHAHEQQEEAYLVIGGSGRAKIEDEIVELRQWDALRVPPATTRTFEGGPDGMELIAIGAPHGDDARILEGWWTD